METNMTAAHTVIKNFTKKGFNMLGSGCYAAVFESNVDPNLVYKVGISTTDPFLSYIQDSSLADNLHFPRIYDIAYLNGGYLVKMERLEPIPSHKVEMSKELRSVVHDDIHTLKHLKASNELSRIATRIRELADSLDVKLDLHEGNIMMRGVTPVITDPLCDHNIYSEWSLDTWLGQKNMCKSSYAYSY